MKGYNISREGSITYFFPFFFPSLVPYVSGIGRVWYRHVLSFCYELVLSGRLAMHRSVLIGRFFWTCFFDTVCIMHQPTQLESLPARVFTLIGKDDFWICRTNFSVRNLGKKTIKKVTFFSFLWYLREIGSDSQILFGPTYICAVVPRSVLPIFKS